jgi:DNA-binding NarL/FixJ family response regulator
MTMVTERIITPRELLNSIIREVAIRHNLDRDLIMRSGRPSLEVMAARVDIAQRLFASGLSEERVAAVMHITLHTVRDYFRNHRRRPVANIE